MRFGDPVPAVQVREIPDPMPADIAVLDVRESFEWDAGHLPGAIHIPLGELPGRTDEVPSGRVLVVCHVGARSAHATAFLRRQGVDAVNLTGGMAAWQAARRPFVSETDGPATVD